MTTRDIRYQAAVIDDAQRLLLLFCVPHGEPGFWVLPGGGREDGESAEACVAREVREEANIEVAVGALLCDVVADPPDGTYHRWQTYRCHVKHGTPTPGSGEGGWATLTAVQWLPLTEPDTWESALGGDPFLRPQLRRIREAVLEFDTAAATGLTAPPSAPPHAATPATASPAPPHHPD
ncbi:MAG: NUDIX hydrolase [Gemmatimonadota bacterium]